MSSPSARFSVIDTRFKDQYFLKGRTLSTKTATVKEVSKASRKDSRFILGALIIMFALIY